MQEQLLLFAQDLKVIVQEERSRREEAEVAVRELQEQQLAVIRTLAFVAENKDPYTRDHLDRTYQFAMRLTRRVAPHLAERAEIGYGFLLHDIGKVLIPDRILNKPAPLTDEEWEVMRTHPVLGGHLMAPIRFMGDAIGIIKQHHERWDGNGYPEGLGGEDIYLGARIFSLIDTFDAMIYDRPYRKGLAVHKALEEIDHYAGTQFDPELAREFIALAKELGLEDADSGANLTFVR